MTIFNYLKKFVKNPSFVDEGEVRLCFDSKTIDESLKLMKLMKGHISEGAFNHYKKSFLDLLESLEIEKCEFTMSKRGVRSYHNLCLKDVWGSGVIPEIILGPMCTQNKRELQLFLKSNGLSSTKIIESKVPIR